MTCREEEGRHGLRPDREERDRRRRHRPGPAAGRHRRARRADRRRGPSDGERRRRASGRGGRPLRGARDHRRPHPLRPPADVRRVGHVVLLPRRHHRAGGKLRVLHRTDARARPRLHLADVRPGRGHVAGGVVGGGVGLRELPGVLRGAARPARCEPRVLRGPLDRAPLGDGARRVRARGHLRRGGADAPGGGQVDGRRRGRLLVVARAHPARWRRQAHPEPFRRPRRAARARGRGRPPPRRERLLPSGQLHRGPRPRRQGVAGRARRRQPPADRDPGPGRAQQGRRADRGVARGRGLPRRCRPPRRRHLQPPAQPSVRPGLLARERHPAVRRRTRVGRAHVPLARREAGPPARPRRARRAARRGRPSQQGRIEGQHASATALARRVRRRGHRAPAREVPQAVDQGHRGRAREGARRRAARHRARQRPAYGVPVGEQDAGVGGRGA